jgi:hypothetical protein
MKRLVLFAAVALAFSTGAIAQNGAVKSTAAKLSDAQLDQVTAGGMMLFNPGKNVKALDSSFSCMNCDEIKAMAAVDFEGRPGGVKIALNPDGSLASFELIGQWKRIK